MKFLDIVAPRATTDRLTVLSSMAWCKVDFVAIRINTTICIFLVFRIKLLLQLMMTDTIFLVVQECAFNISATI